MVIDKLLDEAKKTAKVTPTDLTGEQKKNWDRLIERLLAGDLEGISRKTLYEIARRACGITIGERHFGTHLEQAKSDAKK